MIKLNGTRIEVTASNDVDALVTALNGRTDATGLVASRARQQHHLHGENVQSLLIEQDTKADVTANLVSVVNAKGASAGVDRTLTIDASDVHIGRQYQLQIANGDGMKALRLLFRSPRQVIMPINSQPAWSMLFAVQLRHIVMEPMLKISASATTSSHSTKLVTPPTALKWDWRHHLQRIYVGDTFGTADGAGITSSVRSNWILLRTSQSRSTSVR